ncbi:hypothetical protein R69619_01240 [Paraburkholderia nemoris]|nr:hypothetical protein R69619_01240 [Paraburkholderia nemoris]
MFRLGSLLMLAGWIMVSGISIGLAIALSFSGIL